MGPPPREGLLAYFVDPDPDDDEDDFQEEGSDGAADGFVADDAGSDDSLLDTIDLDVITPDQAEALAAMVQGRRTLGAGRGRSLQKKFPRGQPPRKSSSVPRDQGRPPRRPPGLDDRKKSERDERIKKIKSKTRCSKCGESGHWFMDDECPMKED